MGNRRVVVTGIGALTPLGADLPTFWQNLQAGKSGASSITHFDASNFKTRFACEVTDYNASDHFDRKEARKLDPFSQYALVSTDEAVRDGKLDFDQLDTTRIGVIWGSGIGGLKTFQDEVSNFAQGDGTPKFSPFFIPKMIIDIASGNISMRYGLQGVNYATVSACASSGNAITEAYNYIKWGKNDAMITGGSEASIIEAAIGGFNSMKALSERNDDPQTASRPFDNNRDGFVLGEGSCTLVLEELEHARARGAKVYAELLGGGMSADAYHLTAPDPNGNGACLVMQNALEEAGISYADIDYINVHGTSTPQGDIAELNAIHQIFGDHTYNLNISSTKSMTGHLLGAAGAIEAVSTIMATAEDTVPPTINHFEDDPNIDPNLNLTFYEAEQRKVSHAMTNTFGFGGHNASLIFKKFEDF
jgi:3-oxoacyl-[acyl-carrier-protein] synthase II